MKFFVSTATLLLLLVSHALMAKENYCIAIRGNGPLVSSHWGALAKIIETSGVPQAMAGGSSAAITQFLLSSIALNPLVKTGNIYNKEKFSLLVKSIEGYFEYLATTKEISAIRILDGDKELKKTLTYWAQKIQSEQPATINPSNMTKIKFDLLKYSTKHHRELEILQKGELKDFINEKMLIYLSETVAMAKSLKNIHDVGLAKVIQNKINYRFNEVKSSIELFGKFNAKTDANLFFRHGLIDFDKFVLFINRLANFYAGYGFDRADKKNLQKFISSCGNKSIGKKWQDLVKEKSSCYPTLFKAISTYTEKIKQAEKQNQRNFPFRYKDKTSKGIISFPTTAVILGNGVEKYRRFEKAYNTTIDPKFGLQFKLKYNQFQFGYWGKQKVLTSIKNNLLAKNGFIGKDGQLYNFSQDRKSRKFRSLGDASWKEILLTSPAEPGLSKAVTFKDPKLKGLLSVGGWSDLHPTPLLKAFGCKTVIYLTRHNGESLFGQGVFKRLFNPQGLTWDDLTAIKNNNGRPNDLTSSWSKFFNLANPNSSLAKSIATADGVYCTNWDAFKPEEVGLAPIVQDAYHSPIYVKDRRNNFFKNFDNQISKSDLYEDFEKLRYPKYAGCIPLN